MYDLNSRALDRPLYPLRPRCIVITFHHFTMPLGVLGTVNKEAERERLARNCSTLREIFHRKCCPEVHD